MPRPDQKSPQVCPSLSPAKPIWRVASLLGLQSTKFPLTLGLTLPCPNWIFCKSSLGGRLILVGQAFSQGREKLQYSHEAIPTGQYLQPLVNTSHGRANVLVFFPPILLMEQELDFAVTFRKLLILSNCTVHLQGQIATF